MIISLINIKPTFSSDKTIYYDEANKKFVYYNINIEDVFDEFKDLVPGDEKEQTIKIKVINKKDNANLYLKINYEENKDIIDNLNINVYKNNNEVIKNNEMFKIINSNEEDIDLGNEIEEYSNNFRMTFYVEDNNELIEVPKTYDNILIYLLLLVVSILLMIISFIKLDKKEEK